MNFEAIYQKYKDGTATNEERAFIDSEIEKARKISTILDTQEPPALNEVEAETVEKAKKAFNLRSTLRTVVITVSCMAILAVLAFGAIFGTAYISANNAKNLSQEEAVNAAKALLLDITGVAENEQIVKETDCELELGSRLTNSIFVYEIELICGEYDYQVEVSAKSGYAVISDKESLEQHERFSSDRKK